MSLFIVGEAYGPEEEREGRPFVGASGRLLSKMLSQIGVPRHECQLTNVFNLRPPGGNDVIHLCGSKAEGIPGRPYLTRGKYARAEYANELVRLEKEISLAAPNCVVALGAAAAWALLDSSGIKRIRGAAATSPRLGVKVIATYHPSAVLREYKLYPVVVADLLKAKKENEFPELRRPLREIWVEPTLPDLEEFYQRHILPAPSLSIDIETKADQITCIGFAPTRDVALVVPFVVKGGNYWPTLREELQAWDFVRRMCALPKAVVGQNFMYDMQFLWRRYGIPVPHMAHDTMLLHHAMQPEMEKSLGFLGSIYTSESSWKWMRGMSNTIKRED